MSYTTTTPVAAASPETGFRDQLLQFLNETGKSNKFSAETSRGRESIGNFVGGIEIDGLGTLPLPVTSSVAAAVKPLCDPAPYGKGMATVVDTNVREAFQVDGDKVTLDDKMTEEVLAYRHTHTHTHNSMR